MTIGFTVAVVLAVVAGILAVLALLGKPNGQTYIAVGVLLLAILAVLEHSGLR
jgi:hypothetical protein